MLSSKSKSQTASQVGFIVNELRPSSLFNVDKGTKRDRVESMQKTLGQMWEFQGDIMYMEENMS